MAWRKGEKTRRKILHITYIGKLRDQSQGGEITAGEELASNSHTDVRLQRQTELFEQAFRSSGHWGVDVVAWGCPELVENVLVLLDCRRQAETNCGELPRFRAIDDL